MSKSIEFNGKRYSTQQVTAFINRFQDSENELVEFLNVSALQAVRHGNVNWLNEIFNSRSMRLKSGKLNKLGVECVDYVKAHVPCVVWNVKEYRFQMKKLKDTNKLVGKLIVPFEKFTDEDTGKELDTLVDADEYPTFRYSLADWRDIVASLEDGKPEASNKKFSTLLSQLESMAAMLRGEKDSKVIGTSEEILTLITAANAVAEAAAIAAMVADTKNQDVETELAEQSADVSGKAETRADHDRERLGNVA